MVRFNPGFWEVLISEKSWGKFTNEDRLNYEPPEETQRRQEKAERAESIWPSIRKVMDEVLTDRQQEVLNLYFLEELNQREIANRLSISQQSVSEHLYGKVRNGHAVGGALRKLRKACLKRGIQWDQT